MRAFLLVEAGGTGADRKHSKEQYFPPENGKKGQQNLVTVMDAERGPGRTDGFTHGSLAP